MPGKIGVKLIPRRSKSGKYHSVRELVFSLLEKSNGVISKEQVDKVVKKEYPNANFLGKNGKGGHFTWYKHKWNKMKLEGANFTLKETKDDEEVGEKDANSNESKKSKVKPTKGVGTNRLGKGRNRGKGRRVPVQPNKRKVDIKARKEPVQREGDPNLSEQPTAA